MAGTTGQVIVVAGARTDTLLRHYATLVQDLSGLPARVLRLDTDSTAPALRDLPPETTAVFLPHPPSRRLPAAPVPVVTGQHSAAITLTAATLISLAQAGRAPQASRVVLAGADTMPTLGPLLMAAGIGDITIWHPRDAFAFPLRRVAARADLVIDLSGTARRTAAPTVLAPDEGGGPLLALPGLLRALSDRRGAKADVEVFLACAFALVLATPPGDRLPQDPSQALTAQVADAAARVLRATEPGSAPPRRHEETP